MDAASEKKQELMSDSSKMFTPTENVQLETDEDLYEVLCRIDAGERFSDEIIKKIKNWTCVDWSGTLLEQKEINLPKCVKLLDRLTNLNLNWTSVSDISAVSSLTNLTDLGLSKTDVSDISALSGLTALTNLGLSGTRVRDISVLSGLTSLTNLGLRHLTLTELPEFLLDLNIPFIDSVDHAEKGIYIHDLTLKNQDINIFLTNDRSLIREYYRQQREASGASPLNEVKVVFLGDGGAGKTLAIERLLLDGKMPEYSDGESTPGISISSKTYKIGGDDIEVHFWDFGGQEIMHSMHRLFLTRRTLYVVFLNARDNRQDEQAWYWLNNIRSFAKDAPALIILNQMEQNPSAALNVSGLKNFYPALSENILKISALNDSPEVFNAQVTESIKREIDRMASVRVSIPTQWKHLMDEIRGMEENYIQEKTFREKCAEQGIKLKKDTFDSIISLLQDTGVCFCSPKNAFQSDYMVLKPEWFMNALYILAYNGRRYAKNGILREVDCLKLFDEDVIGEEAVGIVKQDIRYRNTDMRYILDVIQNFDLLYRIDAERFFMPMLCDPEEPDFVKDFLKDRDTLHTSFEYEYLPVNVIHRLMVRFGLDIRLGQVWRTGALFERSECDWQALVYIRQNKLEIHIIGKNEDLYPVASYSKMLSETISAINRDMGLSAVEFVYYKWQGKEETFRRKSLERALEKGRTEIYSELREDIVGIRDILAAYTVSPEVKIQDQLRRKFQKYGDKCPPFIELKQFFEKEKANGHQTYLQSQVGDLFRFVETQDLDSRRAQELLELLWILHLMDTNRVEKVEIFSSSNEKPTGKKPNEKLLLSTKDRTPKETKEPPTENNDKEEQHKPKPSELEVATKLVLEDFEKWWEEESKRIGLPFSIDKHTQRQFSGSQHGYDVGLNTDFGGLKYWLRFECKDYTSNISDSTQDKTTDLKVRSYAYNLLEFYMESNSDINMRWVLICPFGNLQNDFPEKLFEHWNNEHTFIKIYAIMENGPSITCKDFLSVNKDAYRMIYNKDYDGGKKKEAVFKELYNKIIGTDDVREAALKRLKEYVFWEEFRGHKGLLPIPDRTTQIALKQIINFLQSKKDSTEEKEKTLFVIGEYGTGKSWLCYQAIEQIVLYPNDFPFMPFYLRLKDLSNNKDLDDKTQYKDIMKDTLREFYEKYDEWAGECVRKGHQPVFFLDGFDEVFSGLSATNMKIDFLLSIIYEVKDWYEMHENERAIQKHTKPLLVITSRESDFEVGMKFKDFQYQMEQAEIIELELCSVEEVREEWNKLEKEDHIDRSWIFKLDQKSAFLNIIRRPVFYRLCTDAFKDHAFRHKVDLASVDEVDVLDMLFEYELQNYASGERLDKKELRRGIYKCAVKCSKEKTSQVVYAGQGINQIIHVGMVKIRKDQEKEGTCWVSFEHNIVREYLTAKFLSECLTCCSSEEIENPMSTTFIQTLQELSLTPEALKFLMLCIEKKSPSKGLRYKELLKKWLCNKDVKNLDSRLPARLLEILLQPGCTLSGEQEKRLDLTGLHANDLCLWNCGVRHVDFSHSILKNWQMINMELDDVDLRNANMEGLRLAPDKPISSFCHWKGTKEWHVAALHKNGQLMKYSFPKDSWKQYSSEVLATTSVKEGVFHYSDELMLYSMKTLYDDKENELYQIKSDNELERIVTSSGLCGFITKQGENYQVIVLRRDLAPVSFSIGKIEPRNVILAENGQLFFMQDAEIKLVRQNGEMRQICKWESSYECFTVQSMFSKDTCIFIKSDDSLIQIALDEEMHEVESLRKVLPIQGDLEKMQEMRVLNESALAAVGKDELYILTLEINNDAELVKSKRLKTAIKITNSLLEDEDGRNRVQDKNAFELLSSSMS